MTRRHSNRDRGARSLTFAALALAGCESPAKQAASSTATRPTPAADVASSSMSSASSPNLDPCALRLHDLCGSILLYYFTYQRLPATLDEVNTFPAADEPVPLTCPTSGLPYVYSRDGILLAEKKSRVIVYDPSPAHGRNMRWAIRFREPADDKAIVVDVIALPESFFLFRPPVATTLPAN